MNLFATPGEVMFHHLTADEQRLVNTPPTDGVGLVWSAPSQRAFLFRHWVLTAITLFSALVTLVGLYRWGIGAAGRLGYLVTGVAMVALAVLIATIRVRLILRTYTRYVITPKRILKMDGIVEKRSAAITWSNITDTSYYAGAVGQLLDYGDIRVETANERSPFGALNDVPEPETFFAAMNLARAAASKTPVNEAAVAALGALGHFLGGDGILVERDPLNEGWRIRGQAT